MPCYRAWSPGEPVRQAIIGCMPVGGAARTAHSRAITTVVELADGSVWAVRLPFDVLETWAGLFAVAGYLSLQEDRPLNYPWLSDGASFALGFRVEVFNPSLDPDAGGFWKIREYAIAQALAAPPRGEEDNIGDRVAGQEAVIRSAIADGLAKFVNNLDCDALDLAAHRDAFCSARYNFLVRASSTEQLRYRRQFARTFPVFFPWIAGETEEQAIPVCEVREAIDKGVPLVPLFAARFQVPQNVIRHLINRDEESICAEWMARLPVLLRVLSAIAPEKRPRGQAGWSALASACEMLSQLLGRPITTPLSLSWLRTAYKRDAGSMTAILQGAEPREVISIIDEFTDAIEVALSWELRRRAPEAGAGAIADECRIAIERFVVTHDPLTLYRRALRWRAEYNEVRAAQAQVNRPANAWPAVLPSPVRVADLVIVELDCYQALDEEGRRLNHCVATYEGICRSGQTHIFSVRDAVGRSHSTAEIRLVRHRNGSMISAVIQHQGRGDSEPDGRCREAISGLLRILDKEPCSTRMVALYLTREGSNAGRGRLPRDVDHLLATVDSVRKVFERHGRYDALIREASGGRDCSSGAHVTGAPAGSKQVLGTK